MIWRYLAEYVQLQVKIVTFITLNHHVIVNNVGSVEMAEVAVVAASATAAAIVKEAKWFRAVMCDGDMEGRQPIQLTNQHVFYVSRYGFT